MTVSRAILLTVAACLAGIDNPAYAVPVKALNDANVVVESPGDISKPYLDQTKALAIKFMSADSRFTNHLKANKITGVFLRPVRGYDGGMVFKVQLGRGTERYKFSSIGITAYGQGVWLHNR